MDEVEGWKVAQFASWAVMGILGWLGARSIIRLDKLERNYVSRKELEEALGKMIADREAKHAENRGRLERIEDKIDTDREKLSEIAKDVAVLVTGGRPRR